MKPVKNNIAANPAELALIDQYIAGIDARQEWAASLIEAETGDLYVAELIRRMSDTDEDHPASEAAFDWIN
ncbi:MAG: hypothetical protein EPN97_00460 [Alphaproteobacteria bacterium]|nr:MAG: hypothetical protein EPN97_00460 [Alphaproteobacteria bacterium]